MTVENDANAAAWAEYRFGAARGARVVVCVTLGTGIGGGLVVSGMLYRGAYGVGCEYGHMTVVPDGRRCACGNRGCWEMYASGTALARDARELAAVVAGAGAPAAGAGRRRPDRADRSAGHGRGPGRRPGRGGDLLRDGPLARPRASRTCAAVIDPTMFVIGGGVSRRPATC